MEFFVEAGGRHIEKLCMGYSLLPSVVRNLWFSRLAPTEAVFGRRQCRHANLVPFIQFLSRKLRVLDVAFDLSEEEMDVIGRLCKQLREMKMMCPENDLPQFWTKVGRTLEEIVVYEETSSSRFLNQLKLHCRRLHSLRFIRIHRSVSDDLFRLVVSYSTQLQSLSIGHPQLTRTQYQAIARACPLVDCFVGCYWGDLADVMHGLGERLVRVYMAEDDAPDIEDLREGASTCTRLGEIEWMTGAEPHNNGCASLRTVLEEVQGSIHTLKIEAGDPVNVSPSLLSTIDEICDNGAKLRKLNIVADYFDWHEGLLGKACAFLESVVIQYHRSEEDFNPPEVFCVELARSFSSCHLLKELCIDCDYVTGHGHLESVQRVCDDYRLKSTVRHVRIFGIQYLPVATGK